MITASPSEATSQSHGDYFQNAVKGDDWFRGASDHRRRRDARFDIEGQFDRRARVPTQIKVSGNNTFGFADARRFWEIDEPHRDVLAHWYQDRHVKRVWAVTEFLIHGRMMAMLRGRTSLAEVQDCHDAIRALPREHHEKERAEVDRRIAAMNARSPLVTFNPKVGTGNQRLQVSLVLEVMGRLATSEERYRCDRGERHPNRTLYTRTYGKRVSLPLPISSSRRVYRNGAGAGTAPAFAPMPSLFDDTCYVEVAPLVAQSDEETPRPSNDVAAPGHPAWGSDTLFGLAA